MLASLVAQLLSLVPFIFGCNHLDHCPGAPQFFQQVDYTGGLLAIAPAPFVARCCVSRF